MTTNMRLPIWVCNECDQTCFGTRVHPEGSSTRPVDCANCTPVWKKYGIAELEYKPTRWNVYEVSPSDNGDIRRLIHSYSSKKAADYALEALEMDRKILHSYPCYIVEKE